MDRLAANQSVHQDVLGITAVGTRSAPPVIGITLGDAAGIGPEIIQAALGSGELPSRCDYKVIGSIPPGCIPGEPTEQSAQGAFEALEEAARLLQEKQIAAVVTGPIHKARMHEVGFHFPGQTEFFAERAGITDFAMLLTGGKLTVALVTIHIALAQVPAALNQAEIVRVGKLLARFILARTGRFPRIAVAGLNPHAGEGGAMGREEIETIAPAIKELNATGLARFDGPLSPDTLFYRALQEHNGQRAWDAVLCMYHDQGLIPLKMHAFDSGVNVTLGLPFVRTSPDHGTAFEIAGKGVARPESMISAIRMAAELVLA